MLELISVYSHVRNGWCEQWEMLSVNRFDVTIGWTGPSVGISWCEQSVLESVGV